VVVTSVSDRRALMSSRLLAVSMSPVERHLGKPACLPAGGQHKANVVVVVDDSGVDCSAHARRGQARPGEALVITDVRRDENAKRPLLNHIATESLAASHDDKKPASANSLASSSLSSPAAAAETGRRATNQGDYFNPVKACRDMTQSNV